MSKLLSIVIPAYNEEENILNTAKTVLAIADREQIPCELIFVSDGSGDHTFQRIQEAARLDSRVQGIEFSRNFGKEAAILAGLATGFWREEEELKTKNITSNRWGPILSKEKAEELMVRWKTAVAATRMFK